MVADVRLIEDRIGSGGYVAAPLLPFVTPHRRFAGAAEVTIHPGMLHPATPPAHLGGRRTIDGRCTESTVLMNDLCAACASVCDT